MSKTNKFTGLAAMVLALGVAPCVVAQENPTLFMNRANAKIAKASAFSKYWDGPTKGPKIDATKKRKIAMIMADANQPGMVAMAGAVKAAAAVAGWEVLTFDTFGLTNRNAEAFHRASALKPDGIILAGVGAATLSKEMQAVAAKVKFVGWQSIGKAGAGDGLFVNVGTDPKDIGQTAALYSVTESGGRAGVVLFTHSANVFTAAKTVEITEVIKQQCKTCSMLAIEDVPLAQAPSRMPELVKELAKLHGDKWTHAVAVSDVYLDQIAGPAGTAALEGKKLQLVSAGDGSVSAYNRIRAKKMQVATVPEPFELLGWQMIDELNRAFSGESPSGYVPQAYLTTTQNISFQGGAKNTFDPDFGYRDAYRKIWGK